MHRQLMNLDSERKPNLHVRLPPLNALRAFEAAARLKSLSLAGDELCVTHAAISHQVRQLEAWLGRPLLRRSGRGVVPTRAGNELALAVGEAFTKLAHTSAALKLSDSRRAVSVGCIPSIASRWLVPLLPEFARMYPDIPVQVSYAKAEERLKHTDYDVLITLGEDAGQDVENAKLFSRENKPVCSRYFWERHEAVLSEHSIRRLPLLHDETREAWRDWFRKAGIHDDEELKGPVFADFNLLATALLAGHGVALCPVQVFRNEIANGDLVVLSEIATLEDRGYFITIPRSADSSTKAFRDWFGAAISSTQE
jgi:DNA-binding transcriptional LysR family regulator